MIKLVKIYDRLIQFNTHHKREIRIFASIIWISLLIFILWNSWRLREEIWPYIQQASLATLGWGLVYYLMTLVFAVLCWASIMGSFHKNITLWEHIKIYLTTMVARRLPGSVWYIGGRMMLYKRSGVSQIKTASASSVELLVSFIANCVVGLALIPFGLKLDPLFMIPLAAVIVVGLVVLWPKNLAAIMNRLNRPLSEPISFGRPVLWLLLRSGNIFFGGLLIAQLYQVFQPVNVDQYLLIIGARAVSGAAGMLTLFLPNSFGASDITLAAMLSTMLPITLAALVAIAFRMLTTLFEVLFGIVFYFLFKTSFGFDLKDQTQG